MIGAPAPATPLPICRALMVNGAEELARAEMELGFLILTVASVAKIAAFLMHFYANGRRGPTQLLCDEIGISWFNQFERNP